MSSFQTFDVVYFGDYTRSGDGNDRSLEEARMNFELGIATGFVHVGSKGASGRISEGVLQAARTGVIATLDPDELVLAKLAIITDPELVLNSRCDLPLRIIADRVLAIADRGISADHLEFKRERLREIFGDTVIWTATTYDVLSDLRSQGLRTTGTIWESYGHQPVNLDLTRHSTGSRPIMGTVVPQGQQHWPEREADIARIWDTRRYVVRVLGPSLPPSLVEAATLTTPGERSQVQFVAGLNAFLYYPSGRPTELPMLAIGTCLANEIPVLLPPELRPVVGSGPRYVAASHVEEMLRREIGPERADSATGFDPLEAHQRRLQLWSGGTSPCRVRRRSPRRAMLFPSNGEGLGHVNRLISVASRLPDDVEPVFVSLSQAVGLIEGAGFRAEMIVSHRYAGLDEAAAYPWMEEELADAIRRYRPDVFVFDGGNPYGFMTNVVGRERSMRNVWMRRGMWQADQDNSAVLRKRRFFDVVIEPRDIAGTLDRGASRHDRDGVSMVDPILLLDDDELLSREAAREQLGLNQTELAVLVQLGVGNRTDLSVTQDQVLSHLQAIPGAQIVNLHAPISRFPALPIKGVRNISGFPVSRYLRAFDFAVSAAGYNSFHELAQSGTPTVFAIRMVKDLDDQLARARHAEMAGWGLVVEDNNISELPAMLRSLTDPAVRESMRFNARRSTIGNGAADAAELIAELAR
jgi:hypothetical protein